MEQGTVKIVSNTERGWFIDVAITGRNYPMVTLEVPSGDAFKPGDSVIITVRKATA
jgi:hypothetical protein